MKGKDANNGRVIVIVDAISTGMYFAPHLIKRGYQCLHVLTSRDITAVILSHWRSQDFIGDILYDGDLEKLVADVKAYDVALVIAGSEPGVELADMLSRRLGLPRNDTSLILARRNKYMMQENVRARGIRAIKEKCSHDVNEIVAWAEDMNVWPVVLKPVSSAGTEGVHFCANAAAIRDAYRAIMERGNIFGKFNSSVLAQELIVGREIAVNTVSLNGKHYITDCWQYRKIVMDAVPVYDYLRLAPHPVEYDRALIKYDADILDALGFIVGPAHAEIMVTETGPVLVEVGARVMGGSLPPEILSECVGHNQVDLTLDSFLDPRSFMKHMERPYTIGKHCMIKFLINYKGGRLKSVAGRDEIEKLSSVRFVRMSVKPGDILPRTTDMMTSAGEIILVNEDPAQLEADYQRIAEMEKSGLFEFEEMPV